MTDIEPIPPRSSLDQEWRCAFGLPAPNRQPWPLPNESSPLYWGSGGVEGFGHFITDPPIETFIKNRIARTWLEHARDERARAALVTEGEDAYQDVLVKLWGSWARGCDPGLSAPGNTYTGWLATVAHNATIDAHRKRGRNDECEELRDEHDAARPEGGSGPFHVDELIESILLRLTPDERYLLVQFYLEDRTAQDLAEELGVRVSTVYERLRRIRAKIIRSFPPDFGPTDLPW